MDYNATEKKAPVYDLLNQDDMAEMAKAMSLILSDKPGKIFRQACAQAANTASACEKVERSGYGWQKPISEPRPSDWKRSVTGIDEYITEMKKEAAKREAKLIAELVEDDGM